MTSEGRGQSRSTIRRTILEATRKDTPHLLNGCEQSALEVIGETLAAKWPFAEHNDLRRYLRQRAPEQVLNALKEAGYEIAPARTPSPTADSEQSRALENDPGRFQVKDPAVCDCGNCSANGCLERRALSCASCGAEGCRATWSPDHDAWFCDGCFCRETGRMPLDSMTEVTWDQA